LNGGGPADVRALAVELAAEMIQLAGLAPAGQEARSRAVSVLANGLALAKLQQMVAAQGGDPDVLENPSLLPAAPTIEVVGSPVAGYIRRLDAGTIGNAVAGLGAGRTRKSDAVDHRVGIIFHRKTGDYAGVGEPLFTLHLARSGSIALARAAVLDAYEWSEEPSLPGELVVERVGSDEALR
jgi:thymidine phosphorylase